MTADTIRSYVKKNFFTDNKLQLDEVSYSNNVEAKTSYDSFPLGSKFGFFAAILKK